jgi:hypothetical protein
MACPFCEYGSNDTAYFIIAFFGTIAIGMIFFLFAFMRMNKNSTQDNAANSVLEAEGIVTPHPTNKTQKSEGKSHEN